MSCTLIWYRLKSRFSLHQFIFVVLAFVWVCVCVPFSFPLWLSLLSSSSHYHSVMLWHIIYVASNIVCQAPKSMRSVNIIGLYILYSNTETKFDSVTIFFTSSSSFPFSYFLSFICVRAYECWVLLLCFCMYVVAQSLQYNTRRTIYIYLYVLVIWK